VHAQYQNCAVATCKVHSSIITIIIITIILAHWHFIPMGLEISKV